MVLWRRFRNYGTFCSVPLSPGPLASEALDLTRGLVPYRVSGYLPMLTLRDSRLPAVEANFDDNLDQPTIERSSAGPNGPHYKVAPELLPADLFLPMLPGLSLTLARSGDGNSTVTWRYSHEVPALIAILAEVNVDGRTSLDSDIDVISVPVGMVAVKEGEAFYWRGGGVPESATGFLPFSTANPDGRQGVTAFDSAVGGSDPFIALQLTSGEEDGNDIHVRFSRSEQTAGIGSDEPLFFDLHTDGSLGWSVGMTTTPPFGINHGEEPQHSGRAMNRERQLRDGGHPLLVDHDSGMPVIFDSAGKRLGIGHGAGMAISLARKNGPPFTGELVTEKISILLPDCDMGLAAAGAIRSDQGNMADRPDFLGIDPLSTRWALFSLNRDNAGEDEKESKETGTLLTRLAGFPLLGRSLVSWQPATSEDGDRIILNAHLTPYLPGDPDRVLAHGLATIVAERDSGRDWPGTIEAKRDSTEDPGRIFWRFPKPRGADRWLVSLSFDIATLNEGGERKTVFTPITVTVEDFGVELTFRSENLASAKLEPSTETEGGFLLKFSGETSVEPPDMGEGQLNVTCELQATIKPIKPDIPSSNRNLPEILKLELAWKRTQQGDDGQTYVWGITLAYSQSQADSHWIELSTTGDTGGYLFKTPAERFQGGKNLWLYALDDSATDSVSTLPGADVNPACPLALNVERVSGIAALGFRTLGQYPRLPWLDLDIDVLMTLYGHHEEGKPVGTAESRLAIRITSRRSNQGRSTNLNVSATGWCSSVTRCPW